jgi:hypothetical protein
MLARKKEAPQALLPLLHLSTCLFKFNASVEKP